MLRRPKPEFLQQGRERLWPQPEVSRVFSQPRVHTARLAVRLPSLGFDDERAARFQHAVRTTEKRDKSLVAVVEMDPFRDGEARRGRGVNGSTVGRGNGFVRDHDVVGGLVGGSVLGDPVCRSKGDVVRECVAVFCGVCGTERGDGKRTVGVFAGEGKVVGGGGEGGVETGGWPGVGWLEAPEGASAFPGGADERVVNVDADDAACAPCVCWPSG